MAQRHFFRQNGGDRQIIPLQRIERLREGSLKNEKCEDRDGNKKQITKVIGSKLIMLGERKKKEGREPGDEDDAPF